VAELRFDITGRDAGASRAMRDVAGSADLAARGARLLAESLQKEQRAAAESVGATLTLAKADKLLKDAEDELSGKAEKTALAMAAQAREEKQARQEAEKLAAVQSRFKIGRASCRERV